MRKDGYKHTWYVLRRCPWFAINYFGLWVSSILLFVRSLEVLVDDSGYSSYCEILYLAWIVSVATMFVVETTLSVGTTFCLRRSNNNNTVTGRLRRQRRWMCMAILVIVQALVAIALMGSVIARCVVFQFDQSSQHEIQQHYVFGLVVSIAVEFFLLCKHWPIVTADDNYGNYDTETQSDDDEEDD